MNLLCFALGFTACALITWAFAVYLRGRPEPRSGNPRVCKYCGCADPFPERPASDDIWRKLDKDHEHLNRKMEKWQEHPTVRCILCERPTGKSRDESLHCFVENGHGDFEPLGPLCEACYREKEAEGTGREHHPERDPGLRP